MTTMMLHVARILFRSPPEILGLVAHEAVNRIAKIRASVAIDRDDVPALSQAVGSPGSALLLDAPVRTFHGLVGSVELRSSVELPRSHSGRVLAEVTLLPRLARLRLRRQSRVFTQKSARDVILQLLSEHGVEVRERLISSFPTRELIVQRDESDYAFFRRLAAECGITFGVDHASTSGDSRMTGMGGADVLVLSDHAPYYQPIDGSPELALRRSALEQAMALSEHHVLRFDLEKAMRPGASLLQAFDFARPDLMPRAESMLPGKSGKAAEQLDVIVEDGGDGDETPPDVSAARTRLEQRRRGETQAKGTSLCRRLAVGRVIHLVDHDVTDLNRRFVLTDVIHEAFGGPWVPSQRPSYWNTFSAIPAETTIRPPRKRRPLVTTCETATVVGPPGSEIHADAFGRIKVQFHWDAEGRRDDKTSCWIRVAQAWAGDGWGAQFLPRVGMEVVVQFLGGDIDRPLISGAVYNATHPLPFPIGGQLKSGIRSQSSPGKKGFNELSFEDSAGRELFFTHAQRDRTGVVRNDDKEIVGHDQTLDVSHDRTTRVGNDDRLVVGHRLEVKVADPSNTGTVMEDNLIGHQTGGAGMAMRGPDVAIDAKGKVGIKAGSEITATAPTVTLHADGHFVIDAGGPIDITSSGAINLIAGGVITIKGSDVVVQGGSIKHN